jgi:hypothetical protein
MFFLNEFQLLLRICFTRGATAEALPNMLLSGSGQHRKGQQKKIFNQCRRWRLQFQDRADPKSFGTYCQTWVGTTERFGDAFWQLRSFAERQSIYPDSVLMVAER